MRVEYAILVLVAVSGGALMRAQWWGDDLPALTASAPGESDRSTASADWSARQRENHSKISALPPGMAQEAVYESLRNGDYPSYPDFSERFGDEVSVEYYRTHLDVPDGFTTRNETTALVFKDGELIGRGLPMTHGGERAVSAGDDWRATQEMNRKAIFQLEEGATIQEVRARLGEPQFREDLADRFEVLSYRTHSTSLDGVTSPDETTRLLFYDGKYIASATRD